MIFFYVIFDFSREKIKNSTVQFSKADQLSESMTTPLITIYDSALEEDGVKPQLPNKQFKSWRMVSS